MSYQSRDIVVSDFEGCTQFALLGLPDIFKNSYYYYFFNEKKKIDDDTKLFIGNIITTMMNQIDNKPNSRDTLDPRAIKIIEDKITVPCDEESPPEDPEEYLNRFKDLLLFEKAPIVISLGFIFIWMSNKKVGPNIDFIQGMYEKRYLEGLQYMLRGLYESTSSDTQSMIRKMCAYIKNE